LAAGADGGARGGSVPATQPVVSQPLTPSYANTCGIAGLQEAIQRQVNAARASARVCGGKRLPAAGSVDWNTRLFSAAAKHSADMARRNYFAHSSPDGSRVSERVSNEGYPWRAVGENIAGGNTTVQAVMSGWMASAGHCSNIMNPAYTEVAVACVKQPGSTWGTYWTMVLARR
jgi:uncharacterized protein YkwD